MLGLVLFFLLAMVVSFFCSLMEAVMLSVRHSYIEVMISQGRRSGVLLKALKERIDRPLAAILTLNTVANTVGAAGVGAQALSLCNESGTMGQFLGISAGYVVALASAALTLSILVFSEIIPKTLGAVYCNRLASSVAYLVSAMIWLLKPIVVSSEILARWISPKVREKKISREEMMASAKMGTAEGSLELQETRVIQNLLCLSKVRVKDILTPRSVLMAFQGDMTVELVVKDSGDSLRFSRVPIYGKDLDDITGFVLRYEILQAYSKELFDMPLADMAKPIHAVPDVKDVAGTLDEFIKRREQIFLVVDEYGGTAGIITLEDAVETLLGAEIVDEFDTVEDMRKLALRLWQERKKKHDL